MDTNTVLRSLRIGRSLRALAARPSTIPLTWYRAGCGRIVADSTKHNSGEKFSVRPDRGEFRASSRWIGGPSKLIGKFPTQSAAMAACHAYMNR